MIYNKNCILNTIYFYFSTLFKICIMKHLSIIILLLCIGWGIKAQTDTIRIPVEDPQKAERLYNEGIVLYDNGQLAQSLSKFNEAINIKPDFAKAYYNRGIIKADMKDKSGALADFDKAINLAPTANAYFQRGKMKYDDNNAEGAFNDLTNAIKLDSLHDQSYYYLGSLKYDEKIMKLQ